MTPKHFFLGLTQAICTVGRNFLENQPRLQFNHIRIHVSPSIFHRNKHTRQDTKAYVREL